MNPDFLMRAALVAMGCATAPAFAAPATDDFETGLAAWSVIGDVSTRSGGPATPTSGSGYALLTSATLGADDFPAASGSFNFSGAAAVSSTEMQSALGMPSASLDPDIDNFIFASEGSLMQRSFAVAAGETLRFDWNFLSNENGAGALGDYAFFSLNGSVTRLADTGSTLVSSSFFAAETGYRSFAHTFASATTVVVSLGLVDVNDGSVTSALAVDNFQVSAVSEPGMALLLSLGLGVLGLARQRKRNA